MKMLVFPSLLGNNEIVLVGDLSMSNVGMTP
jgi:hypothetical protein